MSFRTEHIAFRREPRGARGRTYTADVTLTIDGEEMDVKVRASVEYGSSSGYGGCAGAEIDGDIEARIMGVWHDLESLQYAAGDDDRASEALCDACLSDDSDADRMAFA